MSYAVSRLVALAGAVVLVIPGQLPAAGNVTVESAYRSTVLVDQADGSGWSFGAAENRLFFGSSFSGWDYRAELTHVVPTGRLAVGNASGLNGEVYSAEPFVNSFVQIESPNRFLRLSADHQARPDRQDQGRLTLGFQPVSQLAGSVEIGRQNLLPSGTEIWYAGEGGRLDLKSAMTFSRIRMVVDFAAGLHLESSFKTGHFDAPSTLPSGEPVAGQYEAAFDGLWREADFMIKVTSLAGCDGWTTYHRLNADSRLQAYQAGRRFAHLGQLNFRATRLTVGLRRGQWQLRLHRGRAEGDLAGVVHAWPFISGLAIFLGERRHLKAEAELTWHQLDLQASSWQLGPIHMKTDLEYYRIEPTASYVTWRPRFLGFGVDDLQRNSLDLKRADLLRLRLSPTMRWQRLRFQVTAAQFIPLSVAYHSDQGGGDGIASEGEVSSDSGADPDRRHQGFSLAFTVSAGF